MVVEDVAEAGVVVDADGAQLPSKSATTATTRRRGLTLGRLPAPYAKSYGPSARPPRSHGVTSLETLGLGHDLRWELHESFLKLARLGGQTFH
jgi:hypothetical protein